MACIAAGALALATSGNRVEYWLLAAAFVLAVVGRRPRHDEQPQRVPRWALTLTFFAALAASLALYWNTLGGGFAEDDDWRFLFTAQRLVGAKSFAELRQWLLWSHEPWPQVRMGAYPLWVLNYVISHTNPLSYHLTNIACHSLNALLVTGLSWLLCGMVLPSVGAGIIFAVFPLASESVTLFYGISDMLCGTFFLFAMIGFVRWRRGARCYWLVVVASLGAIFTKEYGFVLPLLLFALDLLLTRKVLNARHIARAYLPLVAVILLNLGWRAVMYLHDPEAHQFGVGLKRGVFSIQLAESAWGWLYRLPRALCAPMDGRYAGLLLPGDFSTWKRMLAMLGVLMALGLWNLKAPRTRAILAALAIVFIPGMPVRLGLTDIEALERTRYLYISSIGFCILVGWILTQARAVLPSCLCVIVLYCGIALQNNVERVAAGKLAAATAGQADAIGKRHPGNARLVVLGAFRDTAAFWGVFPGRFERKPVFERFYLEGTLTLRSEDVQRPIHELELSDLTPHTHLFRWSRHEQKLVEVTPLVRQLVSRRSRVDRLPPLAYVGRDRLTHVWSLREAASPLAVSEIQVAARVERLQDRRIHQDRPGKYWTECTLSIFWGKRGQLGPATVRAQPDGREYVYRFPVRNSLQWMVSEPIQRICVVANFASYPGVDEHYPIQSEVRWVRLVPFR